MELETKIKGIISSILEEKDGYLVDLKVRHNQLVQLFIDRDPHITIEDCAYISHFLEKELNKEFSFSENYVLEVSSPGMDQPLKVLRQYKKSIGRNVEVLLFSGARKTGMLMYADEEKIILEEKTKSKLKQQETVQTELPFLQIKSTNLVITF